MNRRTLMKTVALAPVLAAVAPDGGVIAASPAPRTLVPLPFNPSRLVGLSEKLLTSHHANNYGGALKNLVRIEEELARLTPDTPPAIVGALRERALQFGNSVVLHETYFGNLGGDGKRSGALAKQLPANWETNVRAAALSLSGGSGWVTFGLNALTGELALSWSGNHTQASVALLPLLVLDMYEHSYAIDYGAAAAKYVDAFFANLAWAEVERRYEAATRAIAQLKSH